VNLETLPEELGDDLARECLYRFLAIALGDPQAPEWQSVLDADNQRLACEAADLLRPEAERNPIALGFGELPCKHLDLRPVLVELGRQFVDLCRDHDRIFGLVPARECPPYETEYHPSNETFFRSQQLADIAGFYRAFGIEPGREALERPDFLPLELHFMAFVLMKKRLAVVFEGQDPATEERSGVCAETLRSFFVDHISWWMPSFAAGLRRKAESGIYYHLGTFLAAFMPIERARFDVPPPRLPLQPDIIERPEEQSGCTACTGAV
jgi:TorA maturation chaperone TorD